MLEPRRTLPAAGIASPASTLASVVLPAPFRPTSPLLSPAAIWKLASASSSCAPARNSRPVAAITRQHSKRRIGKEAARPRAHDPGYPPHRDRGSAANPSRAAQYPATPRPSDAARLGYWPARDPL